MPNIASLLIYLLIFCIVFAVGYHVINSLVPDAVKKYVLEGFYVIFAVLIICYLLSLVGVYNFGFPHIRG